MTEGRHAARHVTHLHLPPLPLSVLLFERAAIFTAAAENVRDFRNETGKHCLQTDDIDYSEHKLELQFDKQHSARRRSLGRQQKRTNPQHLSAQFPPCIFPPPPTLFTPSSYTCIVSTRKFVFYCLWSAHSAFLFSATQSTTATTAMAAILARSAMLVYRGYLLPCSFL